MNKITKSMVNIGLAIFEIILLYMTISNILYIATETTKDIFTSVNLVIGIIDILLPIYLIILNTKCIIKINSKKKHKEVSKILLISNLSSYIFFCGILYRFESFALYILATVAFILLVSQYKKIIDKKKLEIKSKNKIKLIKYISVMLILMALFMEFWQFSDITKTLNKITENQTESYQSVDDNLNLKIMYAKHKNEVFVKFIACMALVSILMASILLNKKEINSIVKTASIIFTLLSITFIANNNIVFGCAQMPLIYLVYEKILYTPSKVAEKEKVKVKKINKSIKKSI